MQATALQVGFGRQRSLHQWQQQAAQLDSECLDGGKAKEIIEMVFFTCTDCKTFWATALRTCSAAPAVLHFSCPKCGHEQPATRDKWRDHRRRKLAQAIRRHVYNVALQSFHPDLFAYCSYSKSVMLSVRSWATRHGAARSVLLLKYFWLCVHLSAEPSMHMRLLVPLPLLSLRATAANASSVPHGAGGRDRAELFAPCVARSHFSRSPSDRLLRALSADSHNVRGAHFQSPSLCNGSHFAHKVFPLLCNAASSWAPWILHDTTCTTTTSCPCECPVPWSQTP